MIHGYSDADFAGDVDNRRSTSTFLFTLNGTFGREWNLDWTRFNSVSSDTCSMKRSLCGTQEERLG